MKEISYTIREAQLSDLPSLVLLLKDLIKIEKDFNFNEEKQLSGIKQMIEDDRSIILVADRSGDIIGMITAQMLISTAEGGRVALAEDFVVREDFRGRGIGKKIFNEMLTWARRESLTRVQLLADKDNDSALNFYKENALNMTNLICLRRML